MYRGRKQFKGVRGLGIFSDSLQINEEKIEETESMYEQARDGKTRAITPLP